MSWSTPATYTTGQLIGATDLNTGLRDNMNYLFGGRPLGALKYNAPAQYTTTSLVFVDMDAPNLILSVTLSGTRVRVLAQIPTVLVAAGAGNYAALDVIANSTTRMGNATYGLSGYGSAGAAGGPAILLGELSGLTPGVNTFKLQWKAGLVAGITAGFATPFPAVYTMLVFEW